LNTAKAAYLGANSDLRARIINKTSESLAAIIIDINPDITFEEARDYILPVLRNDLESWSLFKLIHY
jgi:hypothetical protein